MEGHELLHVAILASTIMGAAGLALLVLWPLLFEIRPSARTVAALIAGVAVAGVLLLVEWRLVH